MDGRPLEWPVTIDARRDGFKSRFRDFMAEALLRQAEADLALHAERGQRFRTFLAYRRLERLRRRHPRVNETSTRVNTYIRTGVRNVPVRYIHARHLDSV